MTATTASSDDVITFRVGSQWFGVEVLHVQEVIGPQRIARVPLAESYVGGLLNLRGQIVTAIDMHEKLEISRDPDDSLMNVVVHDGDELFALLVDEVGDVVTVTAGELEPMPVSVGGEWGRICAGVVRKENGLLAVLHTAQLLDETSSRP